MRPYQIFSAVYRTNTTTVTERREDTVEEPGTGVPCLGSCRVREPGQCEDGSPFSRPLLKCRVRKVQQYRIKLKKLGLVKRILHYPSNLSVRINSSSTVENSYVWCRDTVDTDKEPVNPLPPRGPPGSQ